MARTTITSYCGGIERFDAKALKGDPSACHSCA
jgi:hypothetical protein